MIYLLHLPVLGIHRQARNIPLEASYRIWHKHGKCKIFFYILKYLDQLVSLSLKVGGVRAGKGGTMHLDLPVFNTVEEAMKAVQVQHAVLLLFF